MKDLNGLKVIGIDHGYGNIKTANSVTPTGIIFYESEPTFAGNILTYENVYYKIGEGHKGFIANKEIDDDFYILTLMAIAQELKRENLTEADVHIAGGLPLMWVRTQREDFRKYLLKNKKVKFCFNGINYKINFVGCSLYPQGYPAIIGKLGEMSGVNMLADIGNGTMNIMYINNKKPIESKCWTEKIGVNQCLIAAKNSVMNTFGIKIDEMIIESVIRNGTADIGKEYLNCITLNIKDYAYQLFDTLRKYEYSPDLMKLFVVGGGASIIKNFGTFDENRVIVIDDICATAKGYEHLAYMTLEKKEAENERDKKHESAVEPRKTDTQSGVDVSAKSE